MSADLRITEHEVLAAIKADKKHTVWSPCTTLENMKIEQYPHQPSTNRLAMKAVLETLHARDLLVRRPRLHSHYTFNEVAYERASSVDAQHGDAADGASRRP